MAIAAAQERAIATSCRIRLTQLALLQETSRTIDRGNNMTARMNPYAITDLMKPLIDFGVSVIRMGLEPSLMELVKIRASQIEGCAA
jgi:hypothetical protein